MGTVKLTGRPSGGGGNGEARRTIAVTSWSRLGTPLERASRDDVTLPLPLSEKVTDAVPV
jgi:hypothetical protein